MKKTVIKTDKDGVLTKPITATMGERITVKFAVDFNDLIGIGIDGLNDLADEKVIDNGVLTDISYIPVAVRDGQVIIEVTGYAVEY